VKSSAADGIRVAYPIFWVETGVDDAIHVKVQIVILYPIWIRLSCIDWNLHALDDTLLFFNDVYHNKRILVRQPPIKSRDSHLCYSC
jgi:hypothetical protein